MIKLHKGQFASDRTSCQSSLANQVLLVLRTGAYWLMLALRDAIPRAMPLASAEFATLKLRLLKIGARVVEKAARIRIHFASACPDAALFRLLAGRLAVAGHSERRGALPRIPKLPPNSETANREIRCWMASQSSPRPETTCLSGNPP